MHPRPALLMARLEGASAFRGLSVQVRREPPGQRNSGLLTSFRARAVATRWRHRQPLRVRTSVRTGRWLPEPDAISNSPSRVRERANPHSRGRQGMSRVRRTVRLGTEQDSNSNHSGGPIRTRTPSGRRSAPRTGCRLVGADHPCAADAWSIALCATRQKRRPGLRTIRGHAVAETG